MFPPPVMPVGWIIAEFHFLVCFSFPESGVRHVAPLLGSPWDTWPRHPFYCQLLWSAFLTLKRIYSFRPHSLLPTNVTVGWSSSIRHSLLSVDRASCPYGLHCLLSRNFAYNWLWFLYKWYVFLSGECASIWHRHKRHRLRSPDFTFIWLWHGRHSLLSGDWAALDIHDIPWHLEAARAAVLDNSVPDIPWPLEASRSADLDMLVHCARHSLRSGTLLSFVPDVDGRPCSPETLSADL